MGVFARIFGKNQQIGQLIPRIDWAARPEVLFYGLYSEITGGQMPNKVTGASDYLTVSGSAGSETYQCPNTAPYIAADTDYIWFKTDESRRTTTTAELIGYDFGRTIIKYANTSPYAIQAILILKSGEILTQELENKMRTDFTLSVWWDGLINNYGNLKGNRANMQSVWSAEEITAYVKMLSHFDGADNAVATSDEMRGAWSFVGSPSLKTAIKKFGASSIFFPEGKNYIALANDASMNLGNGDFTIDMWYYPTILNRNNAYNNFLCGRCDAAATASTRQCNIYIINNNTDGSKLKFSFFDTTPSELLSSLGATSLSVNNWYHIAVVRNGDIVTGYVNGVPQGTLNLAGKTLQNVTSRFVIGSLGEYNITTGNARGYIDEFRYSVGVARWTADFSANLPTQPYLID